MRLSSFLIELAISTPEGLPEGSPGEELMPIPSVNVQESSEPDSIQPGTQVAVYIMRFEISFFFVTMGLSNVKSHFFKRGARGEHNEKNVNVKISETTYWTKDSFEFRVKLLVKRKFEFKTSPSGQSDYY